jgi:hypothetical protein
VLRAYAASPRLLALTAAAHSRLCTAAVAGPEAVLQLVGVSGSSFVCLGCRAAGESLCDAGSDGPGSTAAKFICSRSAGHLSGWPSMDPTAALVPLGARVRVDTLSYCSTAISRWTAEEQRLQPTGASAAVPVLRSVSSETVRTYRVKMYKNGVFDERKAAVVLLPGASTAAVQTELLMQEATRESSFFSLFVLFCFVLFVCLFVCSLVCLFVCLWACCWFCVRADTGHSCMYICRHRSSHCHFTRSLIL